MAESLLPSRIFADGKEPIGDRVNSYFKLNTIKIVQKALQPVELEIIKPCFGKLLEVYNKPTFSGKLSHFMLSRQLVVDKPHETWIVFGGKPIRFSLREFAAVTGLNCNPCPQPDKVTLQCKPGMTPYWFTLFGGQENVTGEMLASLLKRSRNLDAETKIKYACLLLVDGLLCRRSYNMKIPKEHVEMIRDLEFFLKYPWGRYAFDLTMQCIKSRTVNQLSQPTVAIQGFIHAMQLVLIEAVPDALTAVGDGTDPESGDEEGRPVSALKLEKLWELDADAKVNVSCIIPIQDEFVVGTDLSWPDEGYDAKVEHMVSLIDEGSSFSREMFVGGQNGYNAITDNVTKKAVNGKRKVKAKGDAKEQSSKKRRVLKTRPRLPATPTDNYNREKVYADMKSAINDVEVRILDRFSSEMQEFQQKLTKLMEDSVNKLAEKFVGMKGATEIIENVMRETINISGTGMEGSFAGELNNNLGHGNDGEIGKVGEDQVIQRPASENVKLNILYQQKEAHRDLIYGRGLHLKFNELLDIPVCIPTSRPVVMDSCVSVLRENLLSRLGNPDPRADIMPCRFASSLAMHHVRFKKAMKKENFQFDPELILAIRERIHDTGKEWLKDVDFIFFPFNIDASRWVGVVVDMISSSLTVFDPSGHVCRGSRMKSEFEFITDMFPHLVLKAEVNENMKNFNTEPLTFGRDTTVVQASDWKDTGMLAILFMEAHIQGGISKVYAVNEEMIRPRAEDLAVEMYEHCCGDIE